MCITFFFFIFMIYYYIISLLWNVLNVNATFSKQTFNDWKTKGTHPSTKWTWVNTCICMCVILLLRHIRWLVKIIRWRNNGWSPCWGTLKKKWKDCSWKEENTFKCKNQGSRQLLAYKMNAIRSGKNYVCVRVSSMNNELCTIN